jgi:magnesium-transporting ATPase (P-type)
MGGKKDVVKQEYERHPFLASVDEIVQLLGTNLETGLNDVKVQELQRKYGPNHLTGEGGVKWYTLLAKQISNAMILVSRRFSLPLLRASPSCCPREESWSASRLSCV